MLDVSVKELVVSKMGSGWKTQFPAEGEKLLHLQPGYTIRDMHEKLRLGPVELSGGAGLTWISVASGTRVSAPCKRGHFFSWHYHPDGDSSFSADDWISFVISDAQMTLLLTANHACLYTKLHKGKCWEVRKAINGDENSAGYRPNLRLVRFTKLIQKELKTHDWTLCAEDQIASALGINYEKEVVK